MALAAALAALPASAGAVQFATQGWGLANSGSNPKKHVNWFNEDGTPSTCPNPWYKVPTETTTPDQVTYQSRKFNNYILEDACITASLSTACSGADALMSESYSPSYDPSSIRTNWIGDLGNNPPAQTSYSFIVPGGAPLRWIMR